MDTETQPTPTQENGAKIEESSSDPPGEVTNEKDVTKIFKGTRQTRSRSRTPQKPKEKKNDDNIKSKKDEPKVLTLSPQNTNKNVNGHSGDSQSCGIKDETKEEKSKEQDIIRNLRSSENKGNKTEEKTESPKITDNLNNDVNKETVESEDNKSEKLPKNQDKKDKLKQSILTEDDKKIIIKDNSTLDSKMSSNTNDLPKSEGEGVEMDPLILATDEPDPELQFDETSDLESGKGSPILSRCKTRRSHTRNIPTPKTPKSTDSESEKNYVAPTPTPENVNDTNDSLNVSTSAEVGSDVTRLECIAHNSTITSSPENLNDINDSINVSTRAEVGSDITRLDYIAHNSTIASHDSSYLNSSRERSLRETLRSLSPRKTIRPINDAYRQRAFKNNQNKSELNMTHSEEDSVDRITGIKRKRSGTPEDRKKFKVDSTGFVSYLSSPLANFKNKFMTDATSSTPKLTSYKDSRKDIHEDISYTEVVSETPDNKTWCTVM